MAAPQPRQILRNLIFSLDGQLMSTAFNQFDVQLSRERLQRSCLFDVGKFTDKGDWEASVKMTDGYGTESEAKLIAGLSQDEEESDFLLLLRSNTKASPMDTPGNPALFMVCQTFAAPQKADRGQIKKISGEFEPGDGRQPNVGVTLYTSLRKIPAPLTEAGGVVTSLPQEIGELEAGWELALSVHCHSITGTGIVSVLVELLSDVDDTFPSPTVQVSLPLNFTNQTPAPVGTVLAPKAQTLVLDGDTDPVPSELAWAIRITVTDSDVDGEVEISAAAALIQK
jgi:hypothetical protein